MKILLTGLSHHTAPVDVRERLAISEDSIGPTLDDLRQQAGAEEAMILSTCNRVEIAVTAADADAAQRVLAVIAKRHSLDPQWLQQYFYRFEDTQAIRHLFRVAASLDSMVLGEPQILGQLKAAYAAAKERGAVHGVLDSILTRAFSVAKRVRSETEIGKSAVSVSFAAVELARQIFGQLKDKRVLLIGAGKMSELAARHLLRAGCGQVFVTNRTRSRADELAESIGGLVIDYGGYQERLPEMDIVITSSGAPDYLLRKDEVRHILDRRRNRPIFLIDIAVPRNVDPAVNELEHVFLYDIDDLGRAVEQNRIARQKEAEQAEEIIAEEIERLTARIKARQVAPAIVSLQAKLDEMAKQELDRFRGKLGGLSPQQEEALSAFTRSLMNKVAHGPLTEMRRTASQPDGDRVLMLVRRMFRLDETPAE